MQLRRFGVPWDPSALQSSFMQLFIGGSWSLVDPWTSKEAHARRSILKKWSKNDPKSYSVHPNPRTTIYFLISGNKAPFDCWVYRGLHTGNNFSYRNTGGNPVVPPQVRLREAQQEASSLAMGACWHVSQRFLVIRALWVVWLFCLMLSYSDLLYFLIATDSYDFFWISFEVLSHVLLWKHFSPPSNLFFNGFWCFLRFFEEQKHVFFFFYHWLFPSEPEPTSLR